MRTVRRKGQRQRHQWDEGGASRDFLEVEFENCLDRAGSHGSRMSTECSQIARAGAEPESGKARINLMHSGWCSRLLGTCPAGDRTCSSTGSQVFCSPLYWLCPHMQPARSTGTSSASAPHLLSHNAEKFKHHGHTSKCGITRRVERRRYLNHIGSDEIKPAQAS